MTLRHYAGACALVAGFISAVLLPSAMAQGEDLREFYGKYSKSRGLLGAWMAGSKDYEKANKEHQTSIDDYTRFVVLGNTYRTRLVPKSDPTADKLLALPDESMRDVEKGMLKAFELPYGADLLLAYEQGLLKHSQSLLEKSTDQYARLNGSRVLPVIGLGLGSKNRDNKAVLELKGQFEVAEGLVQLSNNLLSKAFAGTPRDDGAALYTLRSLKELYRSLATTAPLRTDREKRNAPTALKPDLEEKNLTILADFIEKSPAFLSGAASDEIQGFRLLRREAIRALAANGKAKLGKTSPALTLARVLTRPRAQANPADAFRLDEQVDAAIGLVQTKPEKDFNSNLAAGLVGHFLSEYLAQYGDRANNGELKSFPFAYHAARLNTALADWTTSTNPSVKMLAQRAKTCLTAMEKRDASAQFQEAELLQNLRKDDLLFTGDAASKIEIAAN